MSIPRACQAKDPHACPYHGAVLRKAEAEVKGDVAGYLAACDELKKLKKNKFNDAEYAKLVDDVNKSAFPVRGEPVENPELVEDAHEIEEFGITVYRSKGVVPEGATMMRLQFNDNLDGRDLTQLVTLVDNVWVKKLKEPTGIADGGVIIDSGNSFIVRIGAEDTETVANFQSAFRSAVKDKFKSERTVEFYYNAGDRIEELRKRVDDMEKNDKGYVYIGDIARGELNQQAQYAARYIGGTKSTPDLAEGLRVEGDPANYHSWTFHPDDVVEFIERVRKHRSETGSLY